MCKIQGQKKITLNFKWYVLNTYSGFEYQIKQDLITHIKTQKLSKYLKCILIPTTNTRNLRTNKRIQKKIFSGYILIKSHLNSKMWLLIKKTSKIIGFLGDSSIPFSLKECDIQNIWNTVNEKHMIHSNKLYHINDYVKIKKGPFINFHGIIKNIDKIKKILKISVKILGRNTCIDLKLIDIEKIHR